jgi:hypothetical protein
MLQTAREEAGKAEQVARAARPAAKPAPKPTPDKPTADKADDKPADASSDDDPSSNAQKAGASDSDASASAESSETPAGDQAVPSPGEAKAGEAEDSKDQLPENLRLAYWAAAEAAEANSLSDYADDFRTRIQDGRARQQQAAEWARELRSKDRAAVYDKLEELQGKVVASYEDELGSLEDRIRGKRRDAENLRSRIDPEIVQRADTDPRTRELGKARAALDYVQARKAVADMIATELDEFAATHPNLSEDAAADLKALRDDNEVLRSYAEDQIDELDGRKLAFERQVGLYAFQLPRGATTSGDADGGRETGAAVGNRSVTADAERSADAGESAESGGEDAASDDPKRSSEPRVVEAQNTDAASSIGSDDLWIASLGDSFSSGEGNPTTIGVPINAWKWMDDEKCHRSKYGWPFVVAQEISEHLKKEVRLSFLACSGGELNRGLLQSFTDRGVDRQPQLERLKALIKAAGRTPDAVLMTGGGNDIGFSDIVIECLFPGDCPGGAATDSLKARVARLDGPKGSYAKVDSSLEAMGISSDRVFLLVYPDPLVGRKRQGSGWGGARIIAGCYLPAGPRMWGWASEHVVVPLQNLQRERAKALGWHLIDNHLPEFQKHSYCPRESLRGGDSWWVGILTQVVRQWGLGAFHPNRRGHRELARAAILALADAKIADGLPQLEPRVEEPTTVDDGQMASGAGDAAGGEAGGGGASSSKPSFAVVAALQLRKVRQRGTFTLDMNKYMAGTQVIPFEEPIGDLSRYKDDEDIFRQVNLDQPLFRQREVAFQLDGLNAADFGQFVNFVNVQLRRGPDVREELTVRRQEFNEEGNEFRLIYGFSGEESRDEWMRFEYRTVWSLFNGLTVEEPWESTQTGAVTLAPPYIRRTVELEGDPAALEGVRAVTAHLYYAAGDEERFSELTLRPGRGETVGTADVLLPVGETEYEYEITWIYGNQRSETTGRQRTSNPILFLDPPQE